MNETIIQEMNLASDLQVANEKQLYARQKIAAGTVAKTLEFATILSRSVEIWMESLSGLPQNLFVWYGQSVVLVGRKLISERKLAGVLMELCCSGISESMILGIYQCSRETKDSVGLGFYPLEPGERIAAFNLMKADSSSEIVYPFRYISPGTGKERSSPASGWSLDVTRAANLGVGEEFIRRYTIGWLKRRDLAGKRIYDPACSTGQFLREIKEACPECHTIGQDLSSQMIDYARSFVDEAYCLDAALSPVPDFTADYIFVRFLNSEVVTTEQARDLFPKILQRLKDTGTIVVFGHTPVLVEGAYFAEHGVRILQRVAHDPVTDLAFQYYVMTWA